MKDAALDAARQRGDEVADSVIARLGSQVSAMSTLMQGCRGNAQRLPERLPEVARDFFEQHSALPRWYQPTRVAAAQRWANQHLLFITAALFHASLPSAYAAARGAAVRLSISRMAGDLDRRVNETARFVIDVLAEGSFEPQGEAIRAIQRVRLRHAAVRDWLRERAPFPDEVALNQEDLAGTLFTFSVVVVRALRRLGIGVSGADAEDFYHLWRVVGTLLGIEPSLMPSDFEGAEALSDHIAQRHFRESDAGRALMQALLQRINDHMMFPGMTGYLVRRSSGDRVADLLGISDAVERPALNRLLPQLTTVVGQPLLGSIMSHELGGELRGFVAPGPSMRRSQSR